VLNIVLKLIFRFPEATQLQNSVFRFVRNAVKFDLLLQAVLQAIFPVLVFEAQMEARNAVTANARSFLVDVEHSRQHSPLVDRFLQSDEQFLICEKEILSRFMITPKSGYGGPIVRRRCHSDDAQRNRPAPFEDLD
jgi:hypothetical protein